jgi:hypothetical protein
VRCSINIPRVAFEASPAQREFADAVFSGKYTVLGYGGGIRGGKTFGVFAILAALCRVFPGSRWAIVRKDLPTIKRNVLPAFHKIRDLTGGFIGDVNKSDWIARCANGSEIIFFPESLDTDADLDRWKGLEVNGFVLEEANELAEKSYHKAIERSGAWIVPNGEQPPPLILCTFNPSSTWVRQVFYDPWKHGTLEAPYFFRPALVSDNPYLPQSYLDNLKQMPPAEYKRFVEGDWNVLAGRYFDELDTGVHIVPKLVEQVPAWWEQWAAFDWGFQHHAVAGQFAMDSDGQTWLVDSVWCQRLTVPEIADRMNQTLSSVALREVYAGHDCWARRLARGGESPTIAEEMAERDIWLVKAAIDRIPGWQVLRRALTRTQSDGSIGTPRLLVCDTPGNRRLFAQLSALEHDDTHAEDVSKKKAEQGLGDDGADMLRYGIATRIARPMAPTAKPDPWQHGQDMTEFHAYDDSQPETIGELPIGY